MHVVHAYIVMDFFEDDQSSDQGPPESIPIMAPSHHSWEVSQPHSLCLTVCVCVCVCVYVCVCVCVCVCHYRQLNYHLNHFD